jgi:hypothetical protein
MREQLFEQRGYVGAANAPTNRYQPQATADDDTTLMEDIYDDRRSHSSTRRYSRYVPTFATDRRVVKVTHHPAPPPIQRASLRYTHTTSTPTRTQEPAPPPMQAHTTPLPLWKRIHRTRVHWLMLVGIGMGATFLLLVLFSWASTGISQVWNTAQYGYPRTYQTDADVRHGGISHFLVVNLHGRVVIYETHPDHLATSKVYQGPILEGADSDQYPATIRFADVNGDGLPDLIVTFHSIKAVYINANGGFRPVTPADHIMGGLQ